MSNLITLFVQDISGGTTTNLQGDLLLKEIERVLKTEDSVVLSFNNCTPLSTSFLNSSFGDLISHYGKKEFVRKIKVSDIHQTRMNQLKIYINKTEELA